MKAVFCLCIIFMLGFSINVFATPIAKLRRKDALQTLRSVGPTGGYGIRQITQKIGESLDEVETKVDVLTNYNQSEMSHLDVIESKIDTIPGSTLSEKIYDNTEVIKSKIFVQNTEIEIIDSKIDGIDSTIDEIDSKVDVIDDTLKNIEEIEQVEAHCPVIITQSDIPLNITQPGYYIACDNLVFNPSATGQNAITINSDYVTLDLNSKSLSQGNTVTATGAILIGTDQHDITIKNGVISGFYGSTSADSAYINANARNYHITLDSLNILGLGRPSGNNDGQAIWFDRTRDSVIKNCHISGMQPSGADTTDEVIFFDAAHNISMSNSSINDSYSLTSARTFNALRILDSSNCTIAACQFDNNSILVTSDSAIISVNSANTVSISNSFFNSNNSKNGNLVVVNLISTNGCSISKCSFTYNQATSAGLDLTCVYETNSYGTIIEESTINNNNTTNIATGIHSNLSNGTIIRDVLCNYMQGTTAHGINLTSCTSPSITNCTTSYNSSSGINAAVGCVQPIISSCSAYNNTQYGIYNDSSTAITFDCMASGNGTTNFAGTYPAKAIEPKGNIEYGYDGAGTTALDKKDGIIYIPARAITDLGLNITEPGHYKLTENVSFDGANASTAITISADFVELDLNGFAIHSTNSNSTKALYITSGKHDIEIKNGTIAAFASDSILITDDCYNILLDNLSLIGTTPNSSTGLSFNINGSNDHEVRNVTIQNCTVTKFYHSTPSGIAFMLSNTKEINVINSTFNDNTSNVLFITNSTDCHFYNCQCNGNTRDGNFNVLNISGSNEVNFESCQFNANETIAASSGIARVVQIYDSNMISFHDCSIESNIFLDLVPGSIIHIDASHSIIFNTCSISKNHIYFSLNNDVYCIQIVNGSSGCTIDKCSILSNSAQGTANGRFHILTLDGSTTAIDGCLIQSTLFQNNNISLPGIGAIHGIELIECTGIQILNTKMIATSNDDTPADAYSIELDINSHYCVVQDCTVLRCSGTGIFNDGTNNGFWGNEAFFNGTGLTNYGGAIPPIGTLLTATGHAGAIQKYENVST